MPTIRFVKDRPAVAAAAGTTLMDALLAAGLPVASSCKGDAVCAKCRVRVVDGAAGLSPVAPPEARLRERHRMPPDQRVACQARLLDGGEVTVDTSYW